MPDGLDIIKEYLISLGFKVDNSTYQQTRRVMQDTDRMVSRFASSTTTQFAVAGAGVLGFITLVDAALAKFEANLAQADLKNQQFARLMWMSNDAAYAYNNTLKALGANVNDLWLSPELMQRFQALRQQAGGMRSPEEYAQMMKSVRDIIFEFQRMKLEFSYALQWIGYYLYKYLEGPLGNTKLSLKDFNDKLTKDMPIWTKNVAMVANWFVRLGLAIYHIKEVIGIVVAAFAAVKLLNMGPLGLMIAGLTALLLLVDDYYTYEQGGQSAFPKLWGWLDKLGKKFKESGITGELKDIASSLADIFSTLLDIMGKIADSKVMKNFGDSLLELANGALKVLADVLNGIAYSLKIIDDLTKGDTTSLKKATGYDKPMEEYDPIAAWFWNSVGDLSDKIKGTNWTPYVPSSDGPSFIYPQVSPAGGNSVLLSPTYNIYGASDPKAAANAVDRNNTGLITRAFQGVIK